MKKKETQQDINIGTMSGGIVANKISGGINQTNTTADQPRLAVNLENLELELQQLRKAMHELDVNADHVVATAEIQKAEKAAQAKDSGALLTHLKQAGEWALEVATKIGVNVASEMLKKALGIPN